ncbi:hypothetical protein ONZ45_g17401 [Pleurotus djamor]|nr:hypothetical protein ONZ45_g17401 [Pleurotus djamor]
MSANQDLLQRPSRKGKERDQPGFAENFQDKMIALKRRNANTTTTSRPKDKLPNSVPQHLPQSSPPRSEAAPVPQSSARSRPAHHPPSSPRKRHPSPQSHSSRLPQPDADPEEFSRRLRISSPPTTRPSPTHRHAGPSHHRLYNPDTDSIPMQRTAEPESISDATSSSYVPRARPNGVNSSSAAREASAKQLFDHRKDDPVRFNVLARPQGRPTPTPKSSGDYVSASSTSSYAPSVVSSSFTLSSDTTGGSSASSALFDTRSKPESESGSNKFALQLKNLYRTITRIEAKITQEVDDSGDDGNSRIMLQGKEMNSEEVEKEKWRKQISDHKQYAEVMHSLLDVSFAPSVPTSLRNIPEKYKIVHRLWNHGFYKLLESLRRASFSSPLALEHLQDFIYYAYTFYTGLYEQLTLVSFAGGWLEALGDLARYQMIVASMVQSHLGHGALLTTAALSKVPNGKADESDVPEDTQDSDRHLGDQEPSIGLAAARNLEIEPEKERWRAIAQGWYGKGIAGIPGNGKLQHHLGLLSRDVEGEELRAVYHFVKSMTTLHPFPTSRETVLPIWSTTAQTRRSSSDCRVSDLFVLLHGMLFTNIQLDDFQPTLARFLEKLELEDAEEREWIMMAVINVGAVFEYGKPNSVLSKAGVAGSREGPTITRVMAKNREERHKDAMDVDDDSSVPPAHVSPPPSDAETDNQIPQSFTLALQLTFSMLSHVLRRPPSAVPNPYLTVLFTFLVTILKNEKALAALERNIPWAELAKFFAQVPRGIMRKEHLDQPGSQRWAMITSDCRPPLHEDWCMRGMEWVSKRVYERGFWGSDEKRSDVDVLDVMPQDGDVRIEDDHEDGTDTIEPGVHRWTRIIRCAVGIASAVRGFTWIEGSREWHIEGLLAEKVRRWEELDRIEREEEEKRRIGRRWDDSMDIDEEPVYEAS